MLMIRSLLVLLALITARAHGGDVIIPRPVSEKPGAGVLVLPSPTPVDFPIQSAGHFSAVLKDAGLETQKAADPAKALIRFEEPPMEEILPLEAYTLKISPQGIRILAHTDAARLYAIQSLSQWVAAGKPTANGGREIASVTIQDAPRFRWRGFMLDESRHFTGEKDVKRILDAMARYKLNRFHWHLTDSPGWRIEIKKYPKLTEIGSRGSETERREDAPAQFYTQEQIKDIVAYAKVRGITVIPEIDMPGHAHAANRAYPENDGGGFEGWPRFTFNPAKAETLAFLDDILAEVAALFPDAGVIHFGGDEVHFGWKKWAQLPEVKELMAKENLKDLPEVEAWFNRRMAATINKLGFKTGGWDEIVARGLPTEKTLVWWWRHDKREVLDKALADGYPVILCPRLPCYLDFIQDPTHRAGRITNPPNTIERCYDFPATLNLTDKQLGNVLGIQGCLWTEAAATEQRREFMAWPRLIALSESAWSIPSRKDFASFEQRLKPQLEWLQMHGFTFYDPFKKSPDIPR